MMVKNKDRLLQSKWIIGITKDFFMIIYKSLTWKMIPYLWVTSITCILFKIIIKTMKPPSFWNNLEHRLSKIENILIRILMKKKMRIFYQSRNYSNSLNHNKKMILIPRINKIFQICQKIFIILTLMENSFWGKFKTKINKIKRVI